MQTKIEAVKILATAEAEKEQIEASGEVEAEKLKTEAAEITYRVEAEGEKAINEAKNILSAEQIEVSQGRLLLQTAMQEETTALSALVTSLLTAH